MRLSCLLSMTFQHTAARRRLFINGMITCRNTWFQHTAARRRLIFKTLSRFTIKRFNTQPPEGGCRHIKKVSRLHGSVSTHSRPKAAERIDSNLTGISIVSTHSRPKAAEKKSCLVFKCHLFQHTAARRRLHNQGLYLRILS